MLLVVLRPSDNLVFRHVVTVDEKGNYVVDILSGLGASEVDLGNDEVDHVITANYECESVHLTLSYPSLIFSFQNSRAFDTP